MYYIQRIPIVENSEPSMRNVRIYFNTIFIRRKWTVWNMNSMDFRDFILWFEFILFQFLWIIDCNVDIETVVERWLWIFLVSNGYKIQIIDYISFVYNSLIWAKLNSMLSFQIKEINTWYRLNSSDSFENFHNLNQIYIIIKIKYLNHSKNTWESS